MLLDPGDEVIVVDPYFLTYKNIIEYLGGVPIFLDTYEDFTIDVDKLRSLANSKTKAFIMSSPSNPTGKVPSMQELRGLIEVAEKHGFYIISDELYASYYYENIHEGEVGIRSIPPSVYGRYERTILIEGFSKSHNMTGWRVGYAVGPKAVIDKMTDMLQCLVICAPSVGQAMVLACFDDEVERILHRYRLMYKENRDYLYGALHSHFEMQKTEGAFYAFIKCPWGDGYSFCEKAVERDLIILPGCLFSRRDSHFRVSFSADMRVLQKGCEILIDLKKEGA